MGWGKTIGLLPLRRRDQDAARMRVQSPGPISEPSPGPQDMHAKLRLLELRDKKMGQLEELLAELGMSPKCRVWRGGH